MSLQKSCFGYLVISVSLMSHISRQRRCVVGDGTNGSEEEEFSCYLIGIVGLLQM